MNRFRTTFAVASLAAALAMFSFFSASQPAPEKIVLLTVPTDTSRARQIDVRRLAAVDPDERFRQLALGTWQDYHHGTRTLTLRSDGTATMVLVLSGIKARLFTRRLQLEIVWSIEDGKMHRRTVGGSPPDKVEYVNRRAGVAVAEPILELTDDEMVLLDQNGSQKYHWRRVP